MKKAIAYLTANPARFFLVAAILWMTFMGVLNAIRGIHWNDILIEANGMSFDLLVFGILLSLYEALREKRNKIERLKEEIDDYRKWEGKEAMYRIAGVIRRLNLNGVSALDLSYCFLSGAALAGTDLTRAILLEASLEKANLTKANLTETDLTKATLKEAILTNANLTRANFLRANLNKANLCNANLSGANLTETNLTGAYLTGAYLSRAFVGENWFDKLEKWQVTGRELIVLKYFIDETGRLQQK